jgi:uncharacterized protein with GYD domain
MAKYLAIANYNPEGVRGLLKDGGSKRREVVAKAIESLGGTLEVFYYAFGDADAYIIADFPDNISAAAASLAVNSTGAASSKLVVLMTPEEIDAATQKVVAYTAPGQ